ncbi:MAG TPA: DUF1573 domain-containing protein [Candidatus Binataceae bacterium]|nr:DUF1573 domain-containing protein [Candidatus Binataceae bacterium]
MNRRSLFPYRRVSFALVGAVTLGLIAHAPRGFAESSDNAPLQLPGGLSSDSDSGGLSQLVNGSHGTPSAKTTETTFDFGSVFQGAQVKHTFRIENAGPGTLSIGAVQTSCGCTVAEPTKRQVAAGDSSEIAAIFDTSADKGPSQRVITVHTNDPAHKQIAFTIKGDVKVKVDANPSPVVFDKVKHGTEVSRQVLVTDLMGDKDFKITSITNSSPNLKVTQQPRTDGKPGAALTFTLSKSAPAASLSDTVKVASNIAPVTIPVYANVVGDISVAPPQVSFGIVKHRAGAVQFARVINAGDKPVNLLDARSNNPIVTATIEPMKPGKEYKLTLELTANSPDGTLRGAIEIKTDDPGQPVLQVPFYGIVGGFSG